MARARKKQRAKELQREDARSVAMMQRLKYLLEQQAADPRLGSEPGKLFILGHITAWQHEACRRWGWIADQHHKTQGLPRLNPEGARLDRDYGRLLIGEDEDRALKLAALFNDASETMKAEGGQAVLADMARACLRNEPASDPRNIRTGAAALCRIWQMGREGTDW